MKKYIIKVNGRQYEVEVEAAGAQNSYTPQAAVPSPFQTIVKEEPQKQAPVQPSRAESSGSKGSIVIESPMPGTILKVNVKVGDSVKRAQVLCILEAMKMENEICAPQDGVIASVNVSAGESVESGTLLVSLN
jgi:glutaconyl-CoA/methylmalonyl-CoA decarboxylase subunit gamma